MVHRCIHLNVEFVESFIFITKQLQCMYIRKSNIMDVLSYKYIYMHQLIYMRQLEALVSNPTVTGESHYKATITYME